MWSQSSMYLLPILELVLSTSATPIEQRATSRCTVRDLAIVKRTVIDPAFFCKWWQEDTRTRTPFLEFTVSEVNNLCTCISPISNLHPTKHKRGSVDDITPLVKRSTITTDSCRKEVSLQFTEPWHFCKFYNAYPRISSPFRKYAAKDLLKLFFDKHEESHHKYQKDLNKVVVIKYQNVFNKHRKDFDKHYQASIKLYEVLNKHKEDADEHTNNLIKVVILENYKLFYEHQEKFTKYH
ncbi:hypothetical protein E4T44_08846 [Aureobasidium sp. EXF-8845]|nr:hypothetical protein E4T44_08846 [Aureobasidium sp. EXF-8845]KAI4842913.1 hypothetical protein E4T45_08847 [Aureobasidium sp. EXF-8846]